MKECTQCGKCCLLYSDGGLSASAEEVAAWETFNPAIAKYVVDGKIWVDPDSGEQLTRCPWLEQMPAGSSNGSDKYGCRIYQDRPEDCRHYPTSIAEMVRDGCEMIEVRDLDALEQAQQALDQLMSDSRPPTQQTQPVQAASGLSPSRAGKLPAAQLIQERDIK